MSGMVVWRSMHDVYVASLTKTLPLSDRISWCRSHDTTFLPPYTRPATCILSTLFQLVDHKPCDMQRWSTYVYVRVESKGNCPPSVLKHASRLSHQAQSPLRPCTEDLPLCCECRSHT